MAEFHARFLARAAGDAGRIREALAAGDFATIRTVCHGLSGNAGMFGFDDIGAEAQAVEEAIDSGAAEAAVRQGIAGLLHRLDLLATQS